MATSIRPDAETGQRLDFLAAWTGRPKALLLRELIKRGLDVEEYYLAVEWLERLRHDREETHSAANLRAAPGLDGSPQMR